MQNFSWGKCQKRQNAPYGFIISENPWQWSQVEVNRVGLKSWIVKRQVYKLKQKELKSNLNSPKAFIPLRVAVKPAVRYLGMSQQLPQICDNKKSKKPSILSKSVDKHTAKPQPNHLHLRNLKLVKSLHTEAQQKPAPTSKDGPKRQRSKEAQLQG